MKNQLRAIGDFWRQEYGRFVGMTAIAFLVLTVLAYIAGRLFPDIPVTVMSYFNDMIDSSGIVQEDGSFSVLALLGSNVRAMVLSALYGFIPFLYLPALSLGLNAAIIGMLAAMMQGQWLLFAAGILPHGIFELPALVLSLAAGLCLCQNINHYIRKMKGRHEAPDAEPPACDMPAGAAAAGGRRRDGMLCDTAGHAAVYVRPVIPAAMPRI